jgi:hypothetical protein
MIDIKIQSNNQLCSIKPIDINDASKFKFSQIIQKLSDDLHFGLVVLKRRNYDNNTLEDLINYRFQLGVYNVVLDSDVFEISFCFNTGKVSGHLLSVLFEFWHSFEQPTYYFFETSGFIYQDSFLRHVLSWQEIVNTFNSALLFKDVEEEVIWLAKTEGLQTVTDYLER